MSHVSLINISYTPTSFNDFWNNWFASGGCKIWTCRWCPKITDSEWRSLQVNAVYIFHKQLFVNVAFDYRGSSSNSSSHFSTLLHVLHVHNTAICAKDWVQIMWTFSSLHLKCYCLIALGPKMNFSFCAAVSDFFPNLCGTKIINQHLHLFPFLIQLWFCICWCGEEEESRVLWIATSTSKSKYHVQLICSKSIFLFLLIIWTNLPIHYPASSWWGFSLQVKVGGLIVIDNVLWHGKVCDPMVNQ